VRRLPPDPGGVGIREKLARRGHEALTDEELLALVLGPRGRGTSPLELATGLLRRFGSLRRVGRLSARELAGGCGLGPAAAVRIAGVFALVRRIGAEAIEPGLAVRSSADLFPPFHRRLRDLKREEFIAVLLDGKNRILREETISVGSLTASIVHPREVFLPAVRESAGAVILVHNHPSGDPSPSPEDLEVTRRLVRAGEILGIRVLDHLIVGEGGYTSLLDRGVVPA